jgi:hypothetical protein
MNISVDGDYIKEEWQPSLQFKRKIVPKCRSIEFRMAKAVNV